MRRVTASLLRSLGACKDQVKVFRALWPRGARVTRRALAKAREAGLDVGWLAEQLTSAACAAAQVQYAAARDAAWVQYDAAIDAAWEQYHAALAAARAQYDAAIDAALIKWGKGRVKP